MNSRSEARVGTLLILCAAALVPVTTPSAVAQVPAPPGVNSLFISNPLRRTFGTPHAEFVASPDTGPLPLTVLFDGSTSNDPGNINFGFNWEFGDGMGASGARANHTYSQNGIFTAKLTIADSRGQRNAAVWPIYAGEYVEQPPVCRGIRVTTKAGVPVRVPFAATDPNGCISAPSFGVYQDPTRGTINPDPDSIDNAAVIYTPNPTFLGTDTFYYVAHDGNAAGAPTPAQITVVNNAPEVTAFPRLLTTVAQGARLEATATDDGLPNPPGSLTIRWTAESGPGPAIFSDPTSLVTSVKFPAAGEYALSTTVSDGELRASANVQATVLDARGDSPPSITVTPSEADGLSALIVNFHVDVRPASLRSIRRIAWDFGDGSESDLGDVNPSHTYTASDKTTFFAKVTAYDDAGASNVAVVPVKVEPLFAKITPVDYPEAEKHSTSEAIQLPLNASEGLPVDLSFPGNIADGSVQLYVDAPAADQTVQFWEDAHRRAPLTMQPLPGAPGGMSRRGMVWRMPGSPVPTRVYVGSSGPPITGRNVSVVIGLTVTNNTDSRGDDWYADIADPASYTERERFLGLGYKYQETIRNINQNFNPEKTGTNTKGLVLLVGDSNSTTKWFAPTYIGQTIPEQYVLGLTNWGAGVSSRKDGWSLVSTDVIGKDHTYTAAGGMTIRELLYGYTTPKRNLFPTLDSLITNYNPEFAFVMIGTNDARRKGFTPVSDYKAYLMSVTDKLIANGTIPILVTLPPIVESTEDGAVNIAITKRIEAYNKEIVSLAIQYKLPIIDFIPTMIEMADLIGAPDINAKLKERYLEPDGIHLNSRPWGNSLASHRNLRNNGQMLHIWMAVNKMAYVMSALHGPLPR